MSHKQTSYEVDWLQGTRQKLESMMSDILGQNQTFRTMDGKPIFWRDKGDFVHACEGSEIHRGVTLIWTLCERDVPANSAYKCDSETVTCATCQARS